MNTQNNYLSKYFSPNFVQLYNQALALVEKPNFDPNAIETFFHQNDNHAYMILEAFYTKLSQHSKYPPRLILARKLSEQALTNPYEKARICAIALFRSLSESVRSRKKIDPDTYNLLSPYAHLIEFQTKDINLNLWNKLALSDPSSEVRQGTIATIGTFVKIGLIKNEFFNTLISCLKDNNIYIQEITAQVLWWHAAKKVNISLAIPELKKLASSQNKYVRKQALGAINYFYKHQ